MKYDFTCECGKGIRILRGDLAEVACGGCGKAVAVPPAVRSARPAEFRSFAVEAAPVATEKSGGGETIFFGICWAVGLAMFAVPFFMKSETTELYRKAMADPTSENIRNFTEVEPYGSRRDDVVKAGWNKALASSDVERVAVFLSAWGDESIRDDKEERLWKFADRVGTEKAYELYLNHFWAGARSEDANRALERIRGGAPPAETYTPPEDTYTPPEQADTPTEGMEDRFEEGDEGYDPPVEAAPTPEQERQDLVNLELSPSKEAAIAYLDRYPSSDQRRTVCAILLSQLETAWAYPSDTPSPTVLRQLMETKGSNEVTISLADCSSADAKQQVYEFLRLRLEGIGLRVSAVDAGGDIRVSGSESTDTSRTYNKWGMPESGPFGETMSISIDVYLPGGSDPTFSTSSYATSPASVSYYVLGDVDMGPSQSDVHRATLEDLSKSMESVFQYR